MIDMFFKSIFHDFFGVELGREIPIKYKSNINKKCFGMIFEQLFVYN